MDGYGFFKKFWRVLLAIVVAVVLWYVAPVVFAAIGVPGFTSGVAAGTAGYASIVSGVGMSAGAAALSAGVAGAASGAVTGGGKGALIGALSGAAFSGVGTFVGSVHASATSKFALSVGLHSVVGGRPALPLAASFSPVSSQQVSPIWPDRWNSAVRDSELSHSTRLNTLLSAAAPPSLAEGSLPMAQSRLHSGMCLIGGDMRVIARMGISHGMPQGRTEN